MDMVKDMTTGNVNTTPRQCERTGNGCGSDTWTADQPCDCPQCVAWLYGQDPAFIKWFLESR